jgi:hypothetical protein
MDLEQSGQDNFGMRRRHVDAALVKAGGVC